MGFILGCNYWASHAGTEMWRKWDETVVRKDLQRLAAHGATWLRVFPNWRDFQPIKPLFGSAGRLREYVTEEEGYFDNPYYLDPVMVERFATFCRIAQECGCKLIVGLMTGWMSGRLFIPSALHGKDLLTDPTALLLQQKYCRGLVTALKAYPAIVAWDLGNECNCIGSTESRDTAASWTAMIANAIRAADPSRPIVSGMHSLNLNGPWTIADQAEYTDVLTTHPYPHWVDHCEEDRIGATRTLLHATAQSVYYRSVGQKPCLVEEIGTMGPMICDDQMAADFLRVNLFSNWANGQAGVMWWCAHEQAHLNIPPYTWNMCERELGMLNGRQEPKPVLMEMRKFHDFLEALPYELPESNIDGVCILSQGQDHWGIAYVTYILAKQAGMSIVFCDAMGEIPEAPYYLLPSVAIQVMHKRKYEALKERVRRGAKLYISNDSGFLTEFTELAGLRVVDSSNAHDMRCMQLGNSKLSLGWGRSRLLVSVGAEVLARDDSGNIGYSVNRYGEGEVYYLNFPVEKMLISTHAFTDTGYYEIYRRFFRDRAAQKVIASENPYIGITEHPGKEGVYAVLVNYSGETQKCRLRIQSGYGITRVDYGNVEQLAPYEAAVFYLTT